MSQAVTRTTPAALHCQLYHPGGLDIAAINRHVAEHPQHLLAGYTAPGVDELSNDELLISDVDVLIPVALEQQLRADNASLVQAPMIVEAANGPTTPEADEILRDRGILIVPDILTNAGGVVVSYFEVVTAADLVLDTASRQVTVTGRPVELTAKEFDKPCRTCSSDSTGPIPPVPAAARTWGWRSSRRWRSPARWASRVRPARGPAFGLRYRTWVSSPFCRRGRCEINFAVRRVQ